jgi:hypothetical protein
MSQNSNIITYLKRFSDKMFPVARQQERITFHRNVETLFDTNDLMGIGTYTPTPPLGSLVFWEDAGGTQHCGIAVAHNGYKVYSITHQKGLTQMPQGVRALEARALLEREALPIGIEEETPPFAACLLDVVQGLQTIGFGTFSGAKSGMEDPSDNYDKTYWEEIGETDATGAYEVVLRLKKEVSPALAIGKILTDQDAWSIDCSLFVQVSFLLAMKYHLGDKGFDKRINGIVMANKARFRLRHHHSFGVVQNMVIFRKLIFDKGLDDYLMPTTTEYIRLINGIETALTTTIESLLANAPIGSRVAIMCLNVSKDNAYRIENTIKVGNGLYAGHPLSLIIDGKRTNILSLEDIFQQIATQIVAQDVNQDAATINANLFVSEIEHYDMSWEKK